MLEIAQNFEQMAMRFDPIVLIGPGLAAVLFGLFVWLGGLGFRGILVAVVGAISGGICGFFITGRNVIFTGAVAVICAFIAVLFERFFITILAAGLAAVFGFAVLAAPYIGGPAAVTPVKWDETQNQVGSLSAAQSIETMKVYIADFSAQTKNAYLQMPARSWAIIAALALVLIVAGFFLWRLTSALCCAVVGTVLVFAGMVLLLLYKGAMPISYIGRKPLFCAAVFAAMIAFGTAEQLLLCRRTKTKGWMRKKKVSESGQGPDGRLQGWRTT